LAFRLKGEALRCSSGSFGGGQVHADDHLLAGVEVAAQHFGEGAVADPQDQVNQLRSSLFSGEVDLSPKSGDAFLGGRETDVFLPLFGGE